MEELAGVAASDIESQVIARVGGIFSLSSAAVVALDRAGKIIFVNEGWRRLAVSNGLTLPNFGLGENYIRHCAFADKDSTRIVDGIIQLLGRSLDCLTCIYPCHSPSVRRWFVMLGFSAATGSAAAILVHVDITDLLRSDNDRIEPLFRSEILGLATAPDLHTGPQGRPNDATRHAGTGANAAGNSSGLLVIPRLSPRQRQVFELWQLGLSNANIASELKISQNTVRVYLAALAKLGLSGRDSL